MSIEQVWAFKPIKELNYQTGFVECDIDLARTLIEAGLVQNPNVGGLHLKYIEEATPKTSHDEAPGDTTQEPHEQRAQREHDYETTHLTPRPPTIKRRK